MSKMSEQVRQLVGLENLLVKARRRHRECEREEQGPDRPRAGDYTALIARLSEEIHSADRARLQDYLIYVEKTVLVRIGRRVETTKQEMLGSAIRIVDANARLQELRREYTDALERVRSVRERLSLDPFQPLETKFGFGSHPPRADRRVREAHALVKEYLKS